MKLMVSNIALALALLTLGFQNCSRLESTPVASTEESAQESAKILILEAEQECAMLDAMVAAGSAYPLPDQSSLNGALVGYYTGQTLDQISEGEGTLYIKGMASGATLDSVNGFKGNLVLCEMSVLNLNRVEGTVLIFNGSASNVSNFEGHLIVSGGAINGTPVNSQGIFATHNGDGQTKVQLY